MPKVVILCGGAGTRLREETEYKPKPLVEVGGRPILWHIMKIYAHYGFKHFILCLGYKGQMIKDYFLNYELLNSDFTLEMGRKSKVHVHNGHLEGDWVVTLANTGDAAMTGTRVKRIERYIESETFMVTYGDGVADVDILDLYNFHRSHGRIGTVTGVRPSSRFGELIVEGEAVATFSEKPQVHEGFISGGFFVFNKGFFDYLEDSDGCIMERGPLERLAGDGQLMVHRHQGFWQCMDTVRDLQLLNHLWQSPAPPWKVWEDRPCKAELPLNV
ncbi:MAG: glucose-1-phosphate cytidylyltransferase [Candidatus Eisenbacteria bacterium]